MKSKILLPHQRGYPVSIARPSYVYGPHNYIYREAYFFDRISRGRTILLPEDGNAAIDLVQVDDLTRLLVLVAEKGEYGESYNGTYGKLITANMYAHLVGKIVGKKPKVRHVKLADLGELEWPPERVLYPYIPTGVLGFSAEKAGRIGFSHNYTYRTGLENAYEWWREQGNDEPDWILEDKLISYLNAKERGENTEDLAAELKELLIGTDS